MIALLALLFLVLPAQGKLVPPGGGTEAQAPAAQAQSALDNETAALAKEFSAARAAWERKLDELRKAGESAPQAQLPHPAREFWPRVEALAQRGSSAARLWLALQYPNSGAQESGAAREARWRELILAAVDANASSPYTRDLARSVTTFYLDAPAAAVDEAVERFVQATPQREAAGEALYRASLAKKRGSKELASGKAAEFAKRAAEEYKDTAVMRAARGEVEVGLAVGKAAPDFTAKDADGKEFKLSDYRGKVVVLDFWGFW